VSAGLECREPASRHGDARRAGRVGKGDHAVGVAHVKRIAQQRHAKRLAQVLEQWLADLGHTVIVRVAQQRNPVRTHADSGGTFHGTDHRQVEQRLRRRRHEQRLGDGHVTVRQHMNPAWVLEATCERIDLQACRRYRLLPRRPASGRRHLQRWDGALRLRCGNGWRGADRLLRHVALQAPPHDRAFADKGDQAREDAGLTHGNVIVRIGGPPRRIETTCYS
jgi:hypothetical protein